MKVLKNDVQLLANFKEQVFNLALQLKNFEEGHEFVSTSLAVVVRTILHDTESSKSALTHIGKKSILFLDARFTSDNHQPYLGLVIKSLEGVKDGIGGSIRYKPIFSSDFHYKSIQKNFIDFETWWNAIVFDDGTKKLSRKDLVLTVANKDGGAHIDAKIPEEYDVFKQPNAGGIRIIGSNSGIERSFDNVPTSSSIAHIAFEILESLKNAELITI